MDASNFAALACDLLSKGQRVRFRAPGRSMAPSIPDGAVVVIEPVQPADLRRGDVVAARLARGLVLHRLVGFAKGALLLRGDAAASPGEVEPAAPERVAGRVVEVERGGRVVRLSGRRERIRRRAWALRCLLSRSLRAALATLACVCLFEGGAAATSDFKVGTFTMPAATGAQTVAHGLSGTPKLLILWTTGRAANTAGANYNFSMGFSDSPGSSRSTAMASVSAQNNSLAAREVTTAALTVIRADNPRSVLAECALQSWTAAGFTLNWTTRNAYVAGWTVHFLAVSGTEVQAKVVDWLMPTMPAPKTVAVAGIPFRPDLVIHSTVGSGYTGNIGTIGANAGFSLGYMDAGGNQATSHVLSIDAVRPSDTQRGQKAGSSVYAFDNGLGVTKDGAWVSMDTNGFTIRFNTINNSNQGHVVSLAIKGANIHVGSFNKSTAAQPATQAITGLGFRPLVVALWSDQDIVRAGTGNGPEVEARWGFGAGDGVRQASSAIYDQDGQNRTVTGSVDKSTKVFMKVDNSTGAVNAEANLTSLDAGGFTLTWTANDAVATQMFYFAGGTLSPTAVKLAELSAARQDDAVRVQWRTAGEVDNLGFNVYREAGGERVKVTPSLVAGSALSEAGGTSFALGRTYAWADHLPPGTGPVGYWLEDVDLSGRSTWHGPVATSGVLPPASGAATLLLQRIGRPKVPAARAATRAPALQKLTTVRGPNEQQRIASTGAIKIAVREEGWYSVGQQELLAAGLSASVDPRRLRLYADGAEQAVRVVGEDDGSFDPGDRLEFYGNGVDTPFTDQRIYWLMEGRGRGERIDRVGAFQKPATLAASFPCTVESRDRRIYFAALKNGEADNFFGQVIYLAPVALTLAADALDAQAQVPASLEVALQGATLVTHQVAVALNGVAVGTLQLEGQERGVASFPVAAGLLQAGPNVVSLTSQGAVAPDVSLVDVVRLTYPRLYVVEGNELFASADAGARISVSGFTDGSGRLFDVSDPSRVREVFSSVTLALDGTWTLQATVPGNRGQRSLLAVADAAARAPVAVRADVPSSWSETQHRADALIIGNRALLDATLPLRNAWEQRGLRVEVIDVEDLYDEFSFGEKSPHAIRDFLAHAHGHWAAPPRFVLLVGDASFDPRNRLGLGELDLMPTWTVDTAVLETASDDGFADFDGDGVADLALGRIPARTPQEVAAVVAKTLSFSAWTGLSRRALFVADDPSTEFDFPAASLGAAGGLPAGLLPEQIFRGGRPADQVRADIASLLADAPLFVNYFGHGYEQGWAGGVLDSASSASMPSGPPTVFLSMTCLNGYFQDIYARPLAEALVVADGTGATAAWASSGMGDPSFQRELLQALLRHALVEGRPLGEAARLAKLEVGEPDLKRTFVLFGDPTLQLAPPPPSVGTVASLKAGSTAAGEGCQVVGGESLWALALLGLHALLRRRHSRAAPHV